MRYFSEDHQWIDVNGTEGTIGISQYAADEIGEVNFVELPEIGSKLVAGAPLCVVESLKAAADLVSPVTGIVTEVNSCLTADPMLLNRSPEGEGWLCRVTLSMPEEVEVLMSEEAYLAKVR